MKKLILTIVLFLSMASSAEAKEKLRVLYVGGSPNIETMAREITDSAMLAKSVKERMTDFDKFLRQRFTTVKTINGKDYTPEMSDAYDVTVFDAKPRAIKEKEYIYNDNGQIVGVNPAVYLPADFDNAALFIANASEDLGRSLGSKNDWYCLCLDDKAHHWNAEHPIFKGPFKVNIQTTVEPTPGPALEVAEMMGETLPEQTEMWLVQTERMTKNPDVRIGMVSRPGGYLDSPETEAISSGLCAKSIDAVAIGRHANLFHWGFAASPSHLTQAGKDVLANAIVYASKFNNQHPIARKFNDGVPTRDHLAMTVYTTSKKGWEYMNKANLDFYHTMDSIHQAIEAKKAVGEELTATEKMYASMGAPRKPELVTYDEYVQQCSPELYTIFGSDEQEYARYYEKNRGYFHPETPKSYNLVIDQDVRRLGVANDDIRMLDMCVEMLGGSEKDAELARRVLERYTLCRFPTQQQWKDWLYANRDRMFFTESGGYLWLVNTLDPSVPGNDYSVLTEVKEDAAPTVGDTDENNPVAVTAEYDKAKNEIVVTVTVHPGFHIYGIVDEAEPFIATTFDFELPDGVSLDGELQRAAGTATSNATTWYTGTGRFVQKIKGEGNGDATVKVRYQACDASACKIPTTQSLTMKI